MLDKTKGRKKILSRSFYLVGTVICVLPVYNCYVLSQMHKGHTPIILEDSWPRRGIHVAQPVIVSLTHLAMVGTFIGFHDMVRYTTTFECYIGWIILGWGDCNNFLSIISFLFLGIATGFTNPVAMFKVAWINVIKGQWLFANSTSVWHDYSMLPTITAAIPEPMIIATIGYIML